MSIVAAIEQQERLASGSGSLAEERSDAMDRYLGREYGDEVEGRSRVVMRDVADTIEWIKPSLMKVFCSGDEVVRFEPIGPEDEQQSEQETDYVNHIVQQKNNGFMIFHDWFHDALLQKTGYVWVRAAKEIKQDREAYQGLLDDEFALLMKDQDVEVLEHSEYPGPMGTSHDVVIRKRSEYTCIKLANIPPERVLVATDWPNVSLNGCPFVEVIDFRTLSELRQEGYDVDDRINDNAQYNDDEWEEDQREIDDEWHGRDDIEADPSTRRVRVRYVWMRYDADDDGIAELRHVVVVGKTALNGKDGEETDLTPVSCLTPIRQPHVHHGQSVADIVEDLQRIHTVLVRGFLDNMYLGINGRNAIDASRVNLDDMLTSRPGGVVRVQGSPSDAIMPLVQAAGGADVLSAMEYMRSVKENRTGVTAYNQGMDADSLNKTARGVTQIMTAAQQRVEMIARVFAETGVKDLMLIVHAMSIKHGRSQEMVKLRNQWVPIDPRSWKTRSDMSVAVGLGTGNKDQMLQHLMMILQVQQQAAVIGVATPKNIYNALKRLTQNAGFKQPDEFWTEPPDGPPPPQPNPEMEKLKLEAQAKQMDMQFKAQTTQADIAAKQQAAQIDLEKAQIELQIKELELQLKEREMGLKEQAAAMDLEHKAVAQSMDMQTKQQDNEFKAQDRERAIQQESQRKQESSEQTVAKVTEMVTKQIQGSKTVGIERVRDEKGRVVGARRKLADGTVEEVPIR